MKLLTKLTQTGTALAVLTSLVLSVGTASASAPGQIAGGNQNYKIANVTKGSGFANPQSADACDVLQYRLRLYNPGPSSLNNVKMEASINTMTPYTSANSTATIFTPDGQTKEVAFQAVVNISTAQTQSYQAGTTKLLDSAGNVIQNLPDGVTMGAGGINLGNIGDSVTEYVEFNTQLKCNTPPPTPPKPPVTPPKTPPATPPVTPAAPTSLVNTGPGSDAAIFTIATIAGTLGYRRYLSRRLSRQS
jgi:hypothetical protein